MKKLEGFSGGNVEVSLKKRFIREQVGGILRNNFYREIEPPTVSFLSTFSSYGYVEEERMFKLMDVDGQMLALTPDLTISSESIVLEEGKDLTAPLRLFYTGKAYLLKKDNSRERVYDQLGAELIGRKDMCADAEIIGLAIESIKSLGVENFIVEIEHSHFLRYLLESYGLSEEDNAVIIEAVSKKNNFSVRKNAEKKALCDKVSDLLDLVPSLYGKYKDVIEKAENFCRKTKNDKALGVIGDLRRLYGLLEALGYASYIYIDLTIICHRNFYSGIIFQGMSSDVGAPLFSGGRYDGVYGRERGNTLPAVGFSLSADVLLRLFKAIPSRPEPPVPELLIACAEGLEEKALQRTLAEALSGRRVENFYALPYDDFVKLYADKDVERIYIEE